MKFRENPSRGTEFAETRTDGRTDMTKLIVAFRIFEKAPKIRDPDGQLPVIKKKQTH